MTGIPIAFAGLCLLLASSETLGPHVPKPLPPHRPLIEESRERIVPNETEGFPDHKREALARLPLALRGVSTLYLKVDSDRLTITVRARRVSNEHPGELRWTLSNDLEEPVAADGFAEPLDFNERERSFSIELPAAGLYRLRIESDRSVVYDVETDAVGEGLGDGIETFDTTKPLDLYFQPQPGAFRVEIRTFHAAATGQTVTLHNELNLKIASVVIDAPGVPFSLTATIPSGVPVVNRLWRIRVPMQDMLLNSPQVDVWNLGDASSEPLEPLLGLLTPKSLARGVLPGAATEFILRLNNGWRTERRFVVRLSTPDSENIVLEGGGEIVAALPGGTTRNIRFPVETLAGTIDGATAELTATVFDAGEEGAADSTPLARGRLTLLATGPSEIPPGRPGLLFDGQDVARRLAQAPDDERTALEAVRQTILNNAEGVLSEPVLIHDFEGAYVNLYVCDGIGDGNSDPNDGDGSGLLFEPDRPHEHICPTDGRIYRGSPYNEAWISLHHDLNARRIRALGRAYAVNGDERYARRIVETLDRYADFYLSMPLRDPFGGQDASSSRLTAFTLSEAMWLLTVLEGLGPVWGSASLNEESRVNIEQNLLLPIAENLTHYDVGFTNIQGWQTGLYGLVGLLLDRPSMIEEALTGRRGLEGLLSEGLLPDGVWFEGSPTYHFFGLRPLSLFAYAAERQGYAEWDERVDLAFFGPLGFLQPDNTFPRFNDSSRGSLRRDADLYELAAGRSDDPGYDAVLSRLYDYERIARNHPWTLLFGGPRRTDIPPPIQASEDLPYLGTVILRDGLAAGVFMDYGPQGGVHGHDDKLNIVLYAEDRELLTDLGFTSSFRGSLGTWNRRTLSHNTVLSGESNQSSAGVENQALAFFEPGWLPTSRLQIAKDKSLTGIYTDGASVERTLIRVEDDYWLVVDDVRDGRAPIDQVWHPGGFLRLEEPEAFEERAAPTSWERITWGYQLLRPPRRLLDRNGYLPTPQGFPTTESLLSPIRIRSETDLGLSDTCDDLWPWSGPLSLSDTRAEGEHALRWTVVPRVDSSIGKDLTHNNFSTFTSDRLEFDLRFEGEGKPSSLGLFLQDRTRNAYWDLREVLVEGEWVHAVLNLEEPDAVFEPSDRRQRLTFQHRGPDEGEGVASIFIDNLRESDRGLAGVPTPIGLAITPDTSEPRQVILADGPGEGAGRDIPTVIVRTDRTETRLVTLLESYSGTPGWRLTESDGQSVRIESDAVLDEWWLGDLGWAWSRSGLASGDGGFGDEAFTVETIDILEFQATFGRIDSERPLTLYAEAVRTVDGLDIQYWTREPDDRFNLILPPLEGDSGGGYQVELSGVGAVDWEVLADGHLHILNLPGPDLPGGARILNVISNTAVPVTNWPWHR